MRLGELYAVSFGPYRVLTFMNPPSYAATFFHGVNGTIILYYIPIFLQGAKGVSAIRSSVLTLAGALTLCESSYTL